MFESSGEVFEIFVTKSVGTLALAEW